MLCENQRWYTHYAYGHNRIYSPVTAAAFLLVPDFEWAIWQGRWFPSSGFWFKNKQANKQKIVFFFAPVCLVVFLSTTKSSWFKLCYHYILDGRTRSLCYNIAGVGLPMSNTNKDVFVSIPADIRETNVFYTLIIIMNTWVTILPWKENTYLGDFKHE